MDQMPQEDDSLQDKLLSKQNKESVSSSPRKRKGDKTESAGPEMPKKKKTENEVSSLKSTGATKTTKAALPEKPPPQKKKAKKKVCSIKQAKGSVEKTLVSVKGKVTKIGPVDTVKLKKKTGNKDKREFQLKDITGSIKITLWGEDMKQLTGISRGDFVRVTNVKTSHYNDSVSLNSTDFTRISKDRVPSKQKNKEEVKKKGHFVDEHRVELIQRVTNIAPILDDLLQQEIIQKECYGKIRAVDIPQDKMRELYSGPLEAGDAAKDAFYQILQKHEKILVEDLIQKSTK